MKTISKISGQQLKKDLEATKTKLVNLESKIERKFDLILDNYRKYLSENHKQLLVVKSIEDFTIERKLSIIIQTEANYIKVNGNQVEMFN